MKNNEALKIFGNNLKAERNRLRMSQEEFAEKAGLQMAQISKIEQGQIDFRFSTLVAILKTLDLDFNILYK